MISSTNPGLQFEFRSVNFIIGDGVDQRLALLRLALQPEIIQDEEVPPRPAGSSPYLGGDDREIRADSFRDKTFGEKLCIGPL